MFTQPGMMAQTCNVNIWDAKAEGYCDMLEAPLGFTARLCLKNNKN